MNQVERSYQDAELKALANISAIWGANPTLVQAAGGNTSVKQGETMWIKASGTQLKDAATQDIFVPVDYKSIKQAVHTDLAQADQPQNFALTTSLRPSIETCLHAVIAHKYVAHLHCVNTIAIAIQQDAETQLKKRLQGFKWCLVPYRKPGAQLAAEVVQASAPETNVFVLANHGLIVAGDSLTQVQQLLDEVVAAMRADRFDTSPHDPSQLLDFEREGYCAAEADSPLHRLAMSPAHVQYAIGGSLYPDHVIFCGVGTHAVTYADAIDTILSQLHAQQLPKPSLLLVPDVGALVLENMTSSQAALSTCLADVVLRVPEHKTLNYLTHAQNTELLDWDAEKYRLKLND